MDIRSYYLAKMKKKTRAARMIDLVFFRILLFCVLYVLFLYRTRSSLSALVLSLAIVVSFSILIMYYERRKLKKFIKDYQSKLKTQCALEKISRMPKTQFSALTGHLLEDMGFDCVPAGDGYIDQDKRAYIAVLKRYPQIHSTLQDLTDICAVAAEYSLDRCCVFSVTEFEPQAHELVGRIQWPEIQLYPAAKLLEVYAKYFDMPTEAEITLIIKNEMLAQREAWRIKKGRAFQSANIFKYFLCAAIIYAVGMIIPATRVYYVAFASLAATFGMISVFMSAAKKRA